MVRKTTLLLILALTLTTLFGSFSVAADEVVGPAPVTTSPGPSDTDRVRFEGTITDIAPMATPETGTITVQAVSVTPVITPPWTVHINADTRIHIGGEEGTFADLAIGQQVKVEGTLQEDGSVLAHKIHVRQNDDALVGFRGTIIDKPEITVTPLPTLTVQMGSRTITVVTDENTVITDADGNIITFDDLEVGQEIKGKGVLQENGSILASEIEVLDDNGGPGQQKVRFEGRITDLPDEGVIGRWEVETTNTSSRPVTFSVDENTKITPPGVRPEVGDWAKVTAVRQDGTLLALKVHIKKDHPPRPVEFRGIVKRIEGDPPTMIAVSVLTATDAQNSLVEVLIDEHTRIEGELRLEAHVKVQGFLLDNHSVLARLIVVKPLEVEFRGRIESIADDEWIVAGFTVLITDTTIITGVTPQVGLLAEVKGTQVGPRTVHATEIEVKDPSLEPVVIRGIIAALPETGEITGIWIITTEDGDNVSVEVTADTVIDTRHGEVKIGALVRVTALPQDTGTLVAQRIKVFERD